MIQWLLYHPRLALPLRGLLFLGRQQGREGIQNTDLVPSTHATFMGFFSSEDFTTFTFYFALHLFPFDHTCMFLQATWIVMSCTCTYKKKDADTDKASRVQMGWIFFSLSLFTVKGKHISSAGPIWYFNSTFIYHQPCQLWNIAARCFLLSPLLCSLCCKLWFKISTSSLWLSFPVCFGRWSQETGATGLCFLLSVERHLNRLAIDHSHQGREWVNATESRGPFWTT